MTSRNNVEFNEQESKKILDAINNHHMAELHALAVQNVRRNPHKKDSKVSFPKLSAVSRDAFKVTYVECESNSMCTMGLLNIAFNTSIRTADDAIRAIAELGRDGLEPQWSWLLNSLPVTILFNMAVLGYITIFGGKSSLESIAETIPMAKNTSLYIFGSFHSMFNLVQKTFYIAVVIHALEAIYVACELKRNTMISNKTIMTWFLLVCFTGYPVTNKALEIINAAQGNKFQKEE